MKINVLKKLLIPAALILALAAAAEVFLSRPPVFILTDAPFNALYGGRRILFRRLELAWKLRRPVKPVMIADTAGDDTVELIMEDSGDAYCFLVPGRFSGGARRYIQAHPEAKIALFGVRAPSKDQNDGLFYFNTNQIADFYRAGAAAALLAGGKKVLLFHNWLPEAEDRAALTQGMAETGASDTPVMVSVSAEYRDYSGVGCIILRAAAPEVLNQVLPVPVIIFSWLDPGMMSRANCVVFDDSCWALAEQAVAVMTRPGVPIRTALFPSDMIILKKRLPPDLPAGELFKVRETVYTQTQ